MELREETPVGEDFVSHVAPALRVAPASEARHPMIGGRAPREVAGRLSFAIAPIEGSTLPAGDTREKIRDRRSSASPGEARNHVS
jgi:hypothetical protein